jgi:hypothetical protein
VLAPRVRPHAKYLHAPVPENLRAGIVKTVEPERGPGEPRRAFEARPLGVGGFARVRGGDATNGGGKVNWM